MLPEIHARGAVLVTLSPQLVDFSRAWAEEDGIEFDVLADLGLGVARTYGLVFRVPDYLVEVYRGMGIDLERFNGDTSWELPVPATFVLDEQGTVLVAEADPDYTVRPEPAEIVAALPDRRE